MKKIKTIFVFLAFASFLSFVTPRVFAQDLTVICDGSNCNPSSSPSIFASSEFWYPGKISAKTIRINNSSPTDYLSINTHSRILQLDESVCRLEENLTLSTVRSNSSPPNFVVWSGTLSAFHNLSGGVDLAIFDPGATDDFIYTISMNQSAGNDCQNKITSFDLLLNFSGDTVTPTSTPAPSTDTGGTVSGAGASSTSTPVCNDKKPGNAPILLSAVAGVNNVILNWSEAADPVTYYLIAYGIYPNDETYGNPNVGGKGTTSYTVTNLSSGTNYCFKVRAGNGCAGGDFSAAVCAVPSGVVIPITAVAPGFSENVRGISTLSAGLENKEAVKGKEVVNLCENCLWWPFLLSEIISLYLFFFKLLSRFKKKKWIVLTSVLIPVLTYLLFLWFNRNCLINRYFLISGEFFCKYFAIADSILYAIVSLWWKKKKFGFAKVNGADSNRVSL